MFTRIASVCRESLASRHGGVAIHLGLAAVALLGISGLGSEITFLLYKHRQMQVVADSAAISAAAAHLRGLNATTEARAVAADLGFVDGVGQVTITVNTPPATGPHATNQSAVEVIVDQPQHMGVVGVIRSPLFSVHARAVAQRAMQAPICMLALNRSASAAVHFNNNAGATSLTCGVAANSNAYNALQVDNNGYVDGPVSVVGEWQLGTNSHLNGSPLINHAPLVPDPYANVSLQMPSPCNTPLPTPQCEHGHTNNCIITFTQGGCYSSLDYKNGEIVNLAAGTYFINGAVDIQNNVQFNAATGVTIITGGSFDIKNNMSLNITAPTSGPYAGLALVGLRDNGNSVTLNNNAAINIQGAMYFPNQAINVQNNGATGGTCGQIVAGTLNLANNVTLNNNCAGTGVTSMYTSLSQLVE
jgi:hypothetical protein